MGLNNRILLNSVAGGASAPLSLAAPIRRARDVRDSLRELKLAVHNRLLETIDVAKLESLDPALVSNKLASAIGAVLEEEGRLLTEADRARLIAEIKNEMLGLGPLEPLLWDDEISDILVVGHSQVYIEKRGKLHKTDVTFQDDQQLLHVIERIVSRVGRRVDESSPMVDARLPDGSRVNAIIPPLALDGPVMSIRRFGRDRLTFEELIQNNTLTLEMVDWLRSVVRARLNILVLGGTGSGKTTLLNCLSSFVPPDERIITIEDSAELLLQQPHVVRLETRPPNLEGQGEVTQRDLVRNSLRMRPDRIIIGEVRGPEVLDMLQAMSTGHDGSLCTLHANNPRDGLGRLEMMMLFSGMPLRERAMRQQIASAINLVVHVARLSDGGRKVMKITEISGMEGDTIMMQDLFEFVRSGTSPSGRILGHFRSTGIRSSYHQRLEVAASGWTQNQLTQTTDKPWKR